MFKDELFWTAVAITDGSTMTYDDDGSDVMDAEPFIPDVNQSDC